MAESGPPLQEPQEVASAIVATGTQNPAFPFPLPRVTIRFCTQCKWMLRAAYYAQELLSTFSTSLGEVALQPSTGGTFVVTIQHSAAPSTTDTPPEATIQTRTLWDRKTDGGFPETKELKRRVRDVIEPGRNLGHVDRDHDKEKGKVTDQQQQQQQPQEEQKTEVAQMPEQQQQKQGEPSASGLETQSQHHSEGGNQPEGDFADPIRRGHSRPMMPADGPAAQGQGQGQVGQQYTPRMAGGGNMPVVKPPGEARNEEARAKLEEASRKKEECEDCQ